MTTKHQLTDAEWLARFESGDIDFDLSNATDLRDVADVRAYELLRREYDAAIVGAIRLSRLRGVRWTEIADAVGMTEHEAIETYRSHVGPDVETRGDAAPAEEPPDTRLVSFLLSCREDAGARLAEARDRALTAGVPASFIDSVLSRSDEGARFASPPFC